MESNERDVIGCLHGGEVISKEVVNICGIDFLKLITVDANPHRLKISMTREPSNQLLVDGRNNPIFHITYPRCLDGHEISLKVRAHSMVEQELFKYWGISSFDIISYNKDHKKEDTPIICGT